MENEQLKLLPQTSPHHTALAAISQQHLTNLNHLPLTPQFNHSALRQATLNNLNNSHAANQTMVNANSHHSTGHNPATSIGNSLMGPISMNSRQANTHPLLLGNFISLILFINYNFIN